MRGPSSRILANVVDIYTPIQTSNAEGGLQLSYGSAPTIAQEPCSVQFIRYVEITDEQQRLTQLNEYKIFFQRAMFLPSRSQILWQDPTNTTHVLFFEAPSDEAGRGSTFVVRAQERV